MAKEGRSGLGLGDRLILLIAWVATCAVVYVLGFYVGKGMQGRPLGVEERIVRLPVTSAPPPEGKRPKSEEQFRFYDELMGDRAGGASRAGAPVPADARPAVTPAVEAPRVPAPAASAPPIAPLPGGWTVLANPTRSREEADGLLRQLRTRGYEATLVRVVRDGDTWYRVQVGRFASAEQASEVMHRLREHEGV